MGEQEFIVSGLTAKESAALEELFIQDLPEQKPASISKKVGNSLVKKGMASKTHFWLGAGPMSVKIETYCISIRGHMAYCQACPPIDEGE